MEKNKNYGEMLREIREQDLKMTATKLAEVLGYSQVFITRIENCKKKISKKMFEKLKELIGAEKIEKLKEAQDIYWFPKKYQEILIKSLNLKTGEISESKADVVDKKYLAELKYRKLELMDVPVYSSVSAGLGAEVYSEPVDWIEIPKECGDVVAITVVGDSMENTILDGATVVVKRGECVEIGEVGVFLTNDGEYKNGLVKRLRSKNGEMVLESDNPKYEDIHLERARIRACGKVIKVINDTKKKRKDEIVALVENFSDDKRDIIKTVSKLTSQEIEVLKKMLKGFSEN